MAATKTSISKASASLKRVVLCVEQGARATFKSLEADLGMSHATVWRAVQLAIKRGYLCAAPGSVPQRFERTGLVLPDDVDLEIEAERERVAEEVMARPCIRHPLDVAFFGDYVRAA